MNTLNDLQVGGEYGPAHARFVLIERLDSGGMSTIWKAKDLAESKRKSKECIYGLKFLHHDLTANKVNFKRLQREADRAKKLGHPNIVRVYGFEQGPDGHLFLVMDYLDGRNLAEVLVDEAEENGGLTWKQVKTLLTPVVDALHYAYNEHSVIHRDIKPDNIFLTKDNKIKVLDFGLSEEIKRSSSLLGIQTDDRSGTKVYWAPEICQGAPLSITRDIYAFTAVVYELLVGIPPFPEQIVCERKEDSFPRKPKQLDNATWKALQKGLVYHPKDRPDDIQAFWHTVLNAENTKVVTEPHKKDLGKWLAVGVIGVLIIGAFLLNSLFTADNGENPINSVAIPEVKPQEVTIPNESVDKPIALQQSKEASISDVQKKLNEKQAIKEKQQQELADQKLKEEAERKAEELAIAKEDKRKEELKIKKALKEKIRKEKVIAEQKKKEVVNDISVGVTSGSGRIAKQVITGGTGRIEPNNTSTSEGTGHMSPTVSYTSGTGKAVSDGIKTFGRGAVSLGKMKIFDSSTGLKIINGEIKTCKLYINSTPANATVRILNIKPKYKDGIILKKGKYHVEVSKKGYISKKKWITLSDTICIKDFSLIKLPVKEELFVEQYEKQRQIDQEKAKDEQIRSDSLKKWNANESKRKYEAEQQRIVEQQRLEKQQRDEKIRADALKRWNAQQKQKQVQRVMNNEQIGTTENPFQTYHANKRKIPQNAVVSRLSDQGWNCKIGYEEVGNSCKKIYIPPNAKYSIFSDNGKWACNHGYEQVGKNCKKVYVPPNAKYSIFSDNGKWACNHGYEQVGKNCKKVYIPPNAKYSIFSDNGKWQCNYGYKQEENNCIKISR